MVPSLMIRLCLLFLGFTQTTDGGSHGGGGGGGVHPSATGNGPLAALAGPDAHNGALHGVLRIRDKICYYPWKLWVMLLFEGNSINGHF